MKLINKDKGQWGRELFRSTNTKKEKNFWKKAIILMLFIFGMPFIVVEFIIFYEGLPRHLFYYVFWIIIIVSLFYLGVAPNLFTSMILYEKGILLREPLPILHFFTRFYPWENIIGCKTVKYLVTTEEDWYANSKRRKFYIFFINQSHYEVNDRWFPNFKKLENLIQKYKKGVGTIPPITNCPNCGEPLRNNLCWTCRTKLRV